MSERETELTQGHPSTREVETGMMWLGRERVRSLKPEETGAQCGDRWSLEMPSEDRITPPV